MNEREETPEGDGLAKIRQGTIRDSQADKSGGWRRPEDTIFNPLLYPHK